MIEIKIKGYKTADNNKPYHRDKLTLLGQGQEWGIRRIQIIRQRSRFLEPSRTKIRLIGNYMKINIQKKLMKFRFLSSQLRRHQKTNRKNMTKTMKRL